MGSRPQTGSLTLSLDGTKAYGMAWGGGSQGKGTVFMVSLGGSRSIITVIHNFTGADGAFPYGSVSLSPDGKTLYGMTWQGGKYNNGVVFSLNIASGAYRVRYTFRGSKTDGGYPIGSIAITQGGKTLLGTTTTGGLLGAGTLFKIRV